MGLFTREDLLEALARPGVNAARLARALGVEPPRISEWKRAERPVANTTYTKAQLAAAVAVAQGRQEAAPAVADEALLNALEDDARRMLERIRRARLGAAPSPSQVAAAVRGGAKGRKAQ